MSLELKDSYLVTDLLNTARKLFTQKTLRQLSFIFHPELTYSLEYTDALTNRFRYVQITNQIPATVAFYDFDKIDVGITDLYKDMRTQVKLLNVLGTEAILAIRVALYASGEKTGTFYKSLPGGFTFTKVS